MDTVIKGLVISLVAACATAQAADGLAIPQSAWQTRVSVSSFDASTRLVAASLVGDYYFRSLRLGSAETTGGFRATSGLVLGAGSSLLGAAGVPLRLSDAMALGRLSLSSTTLGSTDAADTGITQPYFGVGFTSVAAAGGWGFSADLGVVAQSTSSALRFGRTLFGTQTLDEAYRNLRLTPVLQLGVRYTF